MVEIVHRALAEEREPRLDPTHASPCGQIAEEHQIEGYGCSQNGVAAEEVHLDLHRIAHPTEEVDVVPCLLIVLAGRIVVDAHLVIDVLIKIGLLVGVKDTFDDGELAHLLRFEVVRIVQHLTIAVAEDVGGEPSADAQQARLKHRRQDGLHQRLPALEVLTGDGHVFLRSQLPHGGNVNA